MYANIFNTEQNSWFDLTILLHSNRWEFCWSNNWRNRLWGSLKRPIIVFWNNIRSSFSHTWRSTIYLPSCRPLSEFLFFLQFFIYLVYSHFPKCLHSSECSNANCSFTHDPYMFGLSHRNLTVNFRLNASAPVSATRWGQWHEN